jgi:hypothetical protein
LTRAAQDERRRSPRVALPGQDQCAVQVRSRVRLLDISVSGALLATDARLPLGAHGQLHFSLAGAAYAPGVQVWRRAPSPDKDLRLGAMFTSMDEVSRRRLEEFLRRATP